MRLVTKNIFSSFPRKSCTRSVLTQVSKGTSHFQQPNEYRFRNVMIHPSGVYNRCSFVSEDTLTSVRNDGTVFLAVRTRTSYEKVVIQSKTVLGKAEPTTFEFRPIAVVQTGEASALFVERIYNILSESSCEFSSFAKNFFFFN